MIDARHLRFARDVTAHASFAIVLLVIACSGCAPAAHLRPAPGILPGHRHELGAGIVRVSPRPYVDEPASASAQLWLSSKIARNFMYSAIGAFDDSAALGGVALRWQPLELDRVAAGAEIEGGFLWIGGSLPVAIRLFDQTWIYGSPRLANWGAELTPFLPWGASVRIVDGFIIRGEAQLSWADFKYYNRRLHMALGVAYDF